MNHNINFVVICIRFKSQAIYQKKSKNKLKVCSKPKSKGKSCRNWNIWLLRYFSSFLPQNRFTSRPKPSVFTQNWITGKNSHFTNKKKLVKLKYTVVHVWFNVTFGLCFVSFLKRKRFTSANISKKLVKLKRFS